MFLNEEHKVFLRWISVTVGGSLSIESKESEAARYLEWLGLITIKNNKASLTENGKRVIESNFANFKDSAWIYQPESLTLYNQKARYEVDLERMRTSAEVLDWILQIAAKAGDKWDLNGFLWALRAAVKHNFKTNPQGAFCPGGRSMMIDWRKKKVTVSRPSAKAN